MAIKKIPCGGFSYDDTEISFEDGVIHPIGGGDGGDDVIFTFDENDNIHCNKTFDEVHAMSPLHATVDDVQIVRDYDSDEQMSFYGIYQVGFSYNAQSHDATTDAGVTFICMGWNRGEEITWGTFDGTIPMNS